MSYIAARFHASHKPSLTEKGPNGGGAAFHRNELAGRTNPAPQS